MDWLNRMNKVMDYIEANLAGEISYDKAAQIACCSTYHFQRMFSFITDIPLSEYIRHRRLTLAAFELQTSDIKVVDVALKYGYESPEAFSRAFKNLHGIVPVSARDIGITLKALLCNYLPKGLSVPSRFTTLSVPSSTWVIFDVPECEMQCMWKRIWSEWFPTSEFEAIEGIQFEMYYGLAKHKNGFGEIWIPIKKK